MYMRLSYAGCSNVCASNAVLMLFIVSKVHTDSPELATKQLFVWIAKQVLSVCLQSTLCLVRIGQLGLVLCPELAINATFRVDC